MVAAVQAVQRLALSPEADRLLAERIADDLPTQPWWVEARGAENRPGRSRHPVEVAWGRCSASILSRSIRRIRRIPALTGLPRKPSASRQMVGPL